jgi:ElaB/YqjD/DUF883 family membrane-anchored ribosome-binding protein
LRTLRPQIAAAGGAVYANVLTALTAAGRQEKSRDTLRAVYAAMDYATLPNPPDLKPAVRAKLDLPDVADDGLALMGALAETRKAVQAARTRLTSFDASLRGQLASAGDERATIEAMRAELREWSEELGKVIEKVGKLSRRAQRERDPDDLRDIDDDHREILGELSKLLVGTGDRASDGLLAGGSKWEETLYALQEAGRNDLVTPLNLELWRLKRDPTLWALVRPARQEPDDLSGPTVSGEASRRAVRRPLLRPSQSDDRSAP